MNPRSSHCQCDAFPTKLQPHYVGLRRPLRPYLLLRPLAVARPGFPTEPRGVPGWTRTSNLVFRKDLRCPLRHEDSLPRLHDLQNLVEKNRRDDQRSLPLLVQNSDPHPITHLGNVDLPVHSPVWQKCDRKLSDRRAKTLQCSVRAFRHTKTRQLANQTAYEVSYLTSAQ